MSLDYQLYLGDCLEVMQQFEKRSIDLILADLPYGTTDSEWDSIIPLDKLWDQYKRVIKEAAIVLTAANPFNYILYNSNPTWFKYDWIWDKKNISNPLMGWQQPLRKHEYVLVFYKGSITYNPQMTKGQMRLKGGRRAGNIENVTHSGRFNILENSSNFNDDYYPKSILEFSNASQTGKIHPNEKPVPLLEYLIKTYSNPGDTVLDNTMGSGSTGEAALRTGRKFIGIEKDESYFEVAKKRLESLIVLPNEEIVKVKDQEKDISMGLW
jgi:DNA modification methylase